MRILSKSFRLALLLCIALVPSFDGFGKGRAIASQDDSLRFEVILDESVAEEPVTARVYVMFGLPDTGSPPSRGPNWFNPQPMFAIDAEDWVPGTPIIIDDQATGFPGTLETIEPGRYAIQAVVRLNQDSHAIGAPGNARSSVIQREINPATDGLIRLIADEVIAPRPFPESDRIKLIEFRSDLLSDFYHREIRHRAAIVLPEGELEPTERRPTIYIIPGFGGNHFNALVLSRVPSFGYGNDFNRVVLDPDCYHGHHVFADSATNGPRGKALIEELIPYIEAHYPAIAEPAARLLNGHSSGGWSSLWLQINYPEYFGGTWSTSPDPVDFHHFQTANIYADDPNMFVDRLGNRLPIARRGTVPVLFTDDFSKLEEVIGEGGQLRSFEAVFSPLDKSSRAAKLWDRRTGAIDPKIANAWRNYDIREILDDEWDRLGPLLEGKIHIWMGDIDTFYLDAATKQLKKTLAELGSDAPVVIVPGADHGSVLTPELAETIDRQMHEAVETKLGIDLVP